MPSSVDRKRFGGSVLAGLVAAAALHLVFGWPFTVVGAALGGFLAGRYGWLSGLLAGVLSWTALALWSLSVDSRAIGEMWRVVGLILGGGDPWVVFVVTISLGALLGASGGWVGANARNLLGPVRR